ncbi:ribonuclease HI [Alloscardovia macacae]|uniref:ribonuclease H n=1 Tax=Alloscardovia macacae TaxID=1160091 RepID=A0A1Y2SZA0_9BIFI|nr:RNase H family protein [Alloscardovia macacae]OTA25610.1 ribonuclease HI [Alloscardovia macacae]OTA28200.1 ribonuclease HI [Alloscardovia macacae]
MTINFTVTVSTDGSALNNPNGPMGWGWVEHTRENPGGVSTAISGLSEDCGGASNGTNQIGELTAVLQCLREHPGDYPLVIETDSQYAINCSTTWIKGWKRNGWKNSKKEPVKNAELIKAIDAELTARTGSVDFVWVKGHAGNFYNEKVDDLARGFAERAGRGEIDGKMPEEGWSVLINGPYARGLKVPENRETRITQPLPEPEPKLGLWEEQLLAEVEEPEPHESTLVDQPLFHEDNGIITEELITRLNQATERFDAAAQRLQLASEHMDQAVAKLDEAIRRFDDGSWKSNHQDTLF